MPQLDFLAAGLSIDMLLAVGPNRHVELGDFVSVLAGGGDLDGASPVEVKVAEGV